MLIEAADSNWMNNGAPNLPQFKLKRLGARHGQKTADGYQAFTNFAFFDGHVATSATDPLARKGPSTTPTRRSS